MATLYKKLLLWYIQKVFDHLIPIPTVTIHYSQHFNIMSMHHFSFELWNL
jgi:hypothetical protein